MTVDIACTADRGPAQVGRLPAVRAGRECVAARSRGLQAVQLGPRGVFAAAGGGCWGRADCVRGARCTSARGNSYPPPCCCSAPSLMVALVRKCSAMTDQAAHTDRHGAPSRRWLLLGRNLGFAIRRSWAPSRVRRQSASPWGVCATYGAALLLAVSRPSSYGKMVPPATPYGKTIPPQGSYIRKIGEGAEVRW